MDINLYSQLFNHYGHKRKYKYPNKRRKVGDL